MAELPHGPSHHERPLVDDRIVGRRVFLFIGVFVALMAALYWFTSYEDAGSVLLLLAAGLALWFGTYLWSAQRKAAAGGAADDGPHYLPVASAWPFAIGLGTATIANGLVLGIWVVVPGVAVLALGIGGFIHQSRHRL
jgi:hypothetical protein